MSINIDLQNVSYRYPDGTSALSAINLALKGPEKIVLLGENGAGKSTLFGLLVGMLRPSQGRLFIDGTPVSYRPAALQSWRSRVGFVFQDPDIQLFSASVKQDVSFGAVNLGLDKKEVRYRTERALEQAGVSALKDKPVHLLSYGQKKLVSIAGVLVMEPELLLLDEPTAWLDTRHSQRVMTLLEECYQAGKTVMLSTHDVNLAYAWAQRVIILKKGSLLLDGSVEQAFGSRRWMEAAGLSLPTLARINLTLKEQGIPSSFRSIKELEIWLKSQFSSQEFKLARRT
jgi:cobalt/nickel transport system ATP-binding protein